MYVVDTTLPPINQFDFLNMVNMDFLPTLWIIFREEATI